MEEIIKINEIISFEKLALAGIAGGVIVSVGICIFLCFLYLGEIKKIAKEIENEAKRKL